MSPLRTDLGRIILGCSLLHIDMKDHVLIVRLLKSEHESLESASRSTSYLPRKGSGDGRSGKDLAGGKNADLCIFIR